jgi:hypothetical protein
VQIELLQNMRRNAMSLKFTIALVALIGCAFPGLAGASNEREAFTSAQYCFPPYDNSDVPKLYC